MPSIIAVSIDLRGIEGNSEPNKNVEKVVEAPYS
jgi:hypothetical protein